CRLRIGRGRAPLTPFPQTKGRLLVRRRARDKPKAQPQFSESFKFFDAVNLGTRDALSIISRPVCGLRALRALRLATLNVPKPGMRTSWPSFMVFSICLITASTATPALSLDSSAASATASIKSFLLTSPVLVGLGTTGPRQVV